jgi:hypothetical protein
VQDSVLSKLSGCETILERSLYKALHELQRLQAARRADVHNSRIVRDSVYVQRLRLDPVGAHDQPLLEGGYRGACLQRNHVPPQNLPHHPHICGLGY